ncbi:hypothetical protein Taro_013878, partial [Colocasia esculenta]|nr:hypothetical protein [Colocasia esculenta]
MILKAGIKSGYQSLSELVDAGVSFHVLDPLKQTILQVENVKVLHHPDGPSIGETDQGKCQGQHLTVQAHRRLPGRLLVIGRSRRNGAAAAMGISHLSHLLLQFPHHLQHLLASSAGRCIPHIEHMHSILHLNPTATRVLPDSSAHHLHPDADGILPSSSRSVRVRHHHICAGHILTIFPQPRPCHFYNVQPPVLPSGRQ